MDVYNFQFAEKYQGFWKIKGSRRKPLAGILSIKNDVISLEVTGQNIQTRNWAVPYITAIEGYAFYKDENEKNHDYHFILKGLNFRSRSVFGKHMFNASYDVNILFVSDKKGFRTEKIRSCCIRNGLMDKWVSDITINSCSFEFPPNLQFKYKQSESMTLFQSGENKIFLYFGYDFNYPDRKGFRLTNKSFLNVEFEGLKYFDESLSILSSIHWLFSIVWNNNSSPEYLCFRTNDGQFLYKESRKYSYKYTTKNNSISTDVNDFDGRAFPDLFRTWFLVLESNLSSVESFFETLDNDFMNPSSRIKNYTTVIDGLVKSEKTELVEVEHGCSDLIEKVSGYINKKESKLLKRFLFKHEPFTLKEKLEKVLCELNSFVEVIVEDDFCLKVVNTRNILTHGRVRKRADKIYKKEQYRDLALCLESLIMAYLLQQIGMPSEIAKKIIRTISSPK